MTQTEPTPPENPENPPVEEPRPEREDDDGSGPSSHETAGQFPADDVRDGPAPEVEGAGDGPSSHETSGEDPAAEVRATHEQ